MKAVLYSSRTCGPCATVERFIASHGLHGIVEVRKDHEPGVRAQMDRLGIMAIPVLVLPDGRQVPGAGMIVAQLRMLAGA